MTDQETKFKEVWEVLSKIDVEPFVEKKNATQKNAPMYLSWMSAWKIANDKFPGVEIEVREWDGKPYLIDDSLGILVETKCTINGVSRIERLPVMDSSFRAQKSSSYAYDVNVYSNGKKVIDQTTGQPMKEHKLVEAATMFDINTAIQRCKTKNLALFGLGYSLYLKEDIWKYISEDEQMKEIQTKLESAGEEVYSRIDSCKTSAELIDLMKGEFNSYNRVKEVHDYALRRLKELNKQNPQIVNQ